MLTYKSHFSGATNEEYKTEEYKTQTGERRSTRADGAGIWASSNSQSDTVVWKNEDIVPHTATGKGVFDSQEIGSMKSWTYKTTRKGKFPYICTYHPTMSAELTVH